MKQWKLGWLGLMLCLCLTGCAAHGHSVSEPVSASQSTPPTLGQHTASTAESSQPTETAEPAGTTSAEPQPDDTAQQSSGQNTQSSTRDHDAPVMTGYLPRGEAIQIAVNHAGVKQADIWDLSCKLEEEDGVMIYQVEFEHGQYEYEYEIDAKTGKILDVEIDD